MKKIIICFAFLLLISPLILAINLEVEKKSSGEVLVLGTDEYVSFNLAIKNLGSSGKFNIYNLVGFDMIPSEPFEIGSGETKNIELKIYPIGEIKTRGGYVLHYFIRESDKSQMEFELPFIIAGLSDAFQVEKSELNSDSDTLHIELYNKLNFNFDSINAHFSSQFTDHEESFSLKPYEKKEFSIPIKKENFEKFVAGFYTLNTEIEVNDKKTTFESTIRFIENDVLKTTESEDGFLVNTQTITKTNRGNILTKAKIDLRKNIISRLFTSFNIEPNAITREGLVVYYVWNTDLKPGESLYVVVTTNWILPFFVILLIVSVVVLVKKNSNTNLVLKKKISFAKARGGEFALKVSLYLHAKKYIENVTVLDKLPPLTKVYEKFGINHPTRVDEKARRIEWTFEKLEAGETRVLSYFIYSKIGIMGRFALPSATAIFEREGKFLESKSNKSFFVSEQRKGEVEDF